MANNKKTLITETTPDTLFVGLGGVGSDIVVRVAEMCKGRETENIRFVVMDTNVNDLKVRLKSSAVIKGIQTSSTQSVLDYLKNNDDARKNWFPNNSILYSKSVSEGAGQVRSISRLAIDTVIKTGEILKLYKAVDELFLKNDSNLKQALRICIVSSAAGGTGSGIAMMIGMLLRKYLKRYYSEKTTVIRGYLVLPGVMDTVITTQTERESQYRNGYATIKEVNAFMMKGSGFCDVKDELKRYKELGMEVPTADESRDELDVLPFDFCFLLDSADSNQMIMKTLDQYKNFAARSLYEQNVGPMQSGAFSMEDNIIKEFANKENLGRNRFGGTGASVLRYPYEDVADYVAYARTLDRIGGGNADADWSRYDKLYKVKLAEFKKKKASSKDAEPTMGDVYNDALSDDKRRFGQDIKRYLATNVDSMETEIAEAIETYLSEVESQVVNGFVSTDSVSELQVQFDSLTSGLNFFETDNTRNEYLYQIRAFENIVRKLARSLAKRKTEALCFYSNSLKSSNIEKYEIEYLLKSNEGGMHPNAMRYVLYALKKELVKLYDEVKKNLHDAEASLEKYSDKANEPQMFAIKRTEEEERCIDDVCRAEISEKKTKEEIGAALSRHIPMYRTKVIEYRDYTIKEAMYEVCLRYVNQLCKEFESFYASFETKVTVLNRKKEDIEEKLKYRKGDIIRNVCADRDCLNELVKRAPESSEGLMLPGELNADIFEAVKKNVAFKRNAEYDPFCEDTSVDIFNEVLIKYFKESVREDCDEVINMNVLRAIECEQRFKAYFDALRDAADDETVTAPVIQDDTKNEYMLSKLKLGYELAAPGISSFTFEEPRVMKLCAFSDELLNIPAYNVSSLLQNISVSPVPSNTVSQYELRFFNALYNVTPDLLPKFMTPETLKIGGYENVSMPGLYYNAYHNYVKNIGPDSTKSMTISLHIDKRWDSIANLPEIDMKAQYEEMLKIHGALVYGVVQGMIKTHVFSRYDPNKKKYALEDKNGELLPFIVSNGTECDEFYEVLDALYSDRASVELIYSMVKSRRTYDEEKRCGYCETVFCKDSEEFRIGDAKEHKTSLFEIPLMYFNSLPSIKIDGNELSIMIDSVIRIMENEVARYEREADRNAFLCMQLEKQFKLLVENFANDEYALRKGTDIASNTVVGMVFRKISNRIKDLQVYDCDKKVSELKKLIRSTAL